MHNTLKHKKCCRGPRGLRGPPGPFMPAPEQLPSVYVFNSGGETVSDDEFLQTNGKTDEEHHAQYLIPRNGELRNLYVELNRALENDNFVTFFTRINGVLPPFTLRADVTTENTTANNTQTRLPVSAGDLVSIIYCSPVERKCMASFELK